MAAFVPSRSVLTAGTRTEELDKQYVSADLLPMLGVQPLRGRLFTAQDDKPRAEDVLIISYRLWHSWFGGDETVVGRNVQLDSRPYRIVGVLPPNFYFYSRETDLWEPFGLDPGRDYRANSGRYMLC